MEEKSNSKSDAALLKGPSVLQYIILEIIQFFPVVIMCTVLRHTGDGLMSVLAFFVFLAVTPHLYCSVFKKDAKLMLAQELGEKKLQTKIGLAAGFALCAAMFIGYLVLFYFDVSIRQIALDANVPLRKETSVAAIFFVLFSFVNPVLEELFWRVFLAKCYPKTEFYNIWVTLHYTFYHVFVLYFIFQEYPIITVCVTVIIMLVGRLFIYLRETMGFFAAVFAHLGVDMSVALMFAHLTLYHKSHGIALEGQSSQALAL